MKKLDVKRLLAYDDAAGLDTMNVDEQKIHELAAEDDETRELVRLIIENARARNALHAYIKQLKDSK